MSGPNGGADNRILFEVPRVLLSAESIKVGGSFAILFCNSFVCGSLIDQEKNR